ncbi:dihydropteroate synthase [Pararhodospirillum photometricum]|nr:dihydropteroate synthase [Pararhodospirillum photometricum]
MAAFAKRPLPDSPAPSWRGFFLGKDAPDPAQALRLCPVDGAQGLAARALLASGQARPLAGDRNRAFTHVVVMLRRPETPEQVTRAVVDLNTLDAWAQAEGAPARSTLETLLDRLSRPRPPFAGLTLEPGRLRVMGIVNVTPDSFSDGGDHASPEAAVRHGLALRAAGADILDVGGESTRPGAQPVDPETEIARVVPVVRALAEAGAVVSIDTRHPRTMAAALAAGAAIFNDITALADPEALTLAAQLHVPTIVMHMQGEPRTMQSRPCYADAALDVYDALEGHVMRARAAGLDDALVCVDPGLGFGKALEHNLDILRWTPLLLGLGPAVLIAASRKRFIGAVTGAEAPKARLPGSLAVALAAQAQGAHLVRVHDVAETAQALAMAGALRC